MTTCGVQSELGQPVTREPWLERTQEATCLLSSRTPDGREQDLVARLERIGARGPVDRQQALDVGGEERNQVTAAQACIAGVDHAATASGSLIR